MQKPLQLQYLWQETALPKKKSNDTSSELKEEANTRIESDMRTVLESFDDMRRLING